MRQPPPPPSFHQCLVSQLGTNRNLVWTPSIQWRKTNNAIIKLPGSQERKLVSKAIAEARPLFPLPWATHSSCTPTIFLILFFPFVQSVRRRISPTHLPVYGTCLCAMACWLWGICPISPQSIKTWPVQRLGQRANAPTRRQEQQPTHPLMGGSPPPWH